MKSLGIILGIAALLLIFILAQGALAAETYNYVTQFGSGGGIAVDNSGNIYAVNGTGIQKFDPDGHLLTQFGPGGGCIAVDASGNIYVTNWDTIQKIDSEGNYITKWSPIGLDSGRFDGIQGIAVDTSGNVYIVDNGNKRIQIFDSNGNYKGSLGGYFNGLAEPVGIAVDGSGVYVADLYYGVMKFGSSGEKSIIPFGGSNDGQITWPHSVAVDSSENIYVSDEIWYAPPRIQKFDSYGNYITKVGSFGPSEGQFKSPGGIVVGPSGDVYVADSDRFMKFSLTTTCSISVTSDPAGAEIYLDGVDTGQITPFILDNLNPGDHTVKVTFDIYNPASRTVNIKPGPTVPVDFKLFPGSSLIVTSTPPGAEIWIDGQDTLQVTPFTFEEYWMNYAVVVKMNCYTTPDQRTVEVRPLTPATADFILTPDGSCIPEFPSPIIPVVMLAGCAGVVLMIARRKE
jgi:hypothetical protein